MFPWNSLFVFSSFIFLDSFVIIDLNSLELLISMETITVGLVVLRGDLLFCFFFFFFNATCAGTYIYQKLAHWFNVLCSQCLGMDRLL